MEQMFQSHAGSIEAEGEDAIAGEGIKGFNPTLVRLRRYRWLEGMGREFRFQSHAGSIEAARATRRAACPSTVSIPRWFD